jgi:hypothetical protein
VHILLGVLGAEDGVGGFGARVLRELGLDLQQVREEVLRLAAEDAPAVADRHDDRAGGHPAEENARLRREVRRLRTRLREAGIDPDAGASRSA